MRVLLTTVGSRGDVQPLLALAMQLKAQGHEVR
ncbi:glycosyltransferase, partial [Pilimelia columellifera]